MIEECSVKRFICDRCGKEMILPKDQKNTEWEYLLFHKIYHLCADCSIRFNAVLNDFLKEDEKL